MKILVVSGHKLIGQSLATMLMHLPWQEAVDVRQCEPRWVIEQTRDYQPSLVLVEASVDLRGGIVTVRAIAQALSDASIVVLGSDEDDETISEVILAGASGYVARDTSPDVFLTTLWSVAHGELGLSRKAALRVVRQMRRTVEARRLNVSAATLSSLTQREQEIFALVRQGLRSREIARRLCIAEATVYKHTQNILDKLHVHSRTQAVFIADIEPIARAPGALDAVRVVK